MHSFVTSTGVQKQNTLKQEILTFQLIPYKPCGLSSELIIKQLLQDKNSAKYAYHYSRNYVFISDSFTYKKIGSVVDYTGHSKLVPVQQAY